MDQVAKEFVSLGTVVLALGIAILTFFVRKITETSFPSLKKRADENAPGLTYPTKICRWWNEVILPLIPVLIGVATSLFPWMSAITTDKLSTAGGQAFFGGVVGWFSAQVYKVIRQLIKKQTGIDIGPGPVGSSEPPAAPPPPDTAA